MRLIFSLLRCVGAVRALSLPNLDPIASVHHGTADRLCCFALTAQVSTETDVQADPQIMGLNAYPSERHCLNLKTFQFLDGDKEVFRAADRRTSEHHDAIYCPTAKSYASRDVTIDIFTGEDDKQFLALNGNPDFTVAPDPASASCTLLEDAQPLTRSSGKTRAKSRSAFSSRTKPQAAGCCPSLQLKVLQQLRASTCQSSWGAETLPHAAVQTQQSRAQLPAHRLPWPHPRFLLGVQTLRCYYSL